MQTGTNNKYIKTLILLYFGYFIDFYDLTIFSVNYSNIIPDLFHVENLIAIQKLYLIITNFYTLGIILGGVFFGILGDKIGRGVVIRQSILIYSIAILLSVFTHSIYVFILLRAIAGFGLATEFATSSVLISELIGHNKNSQSSITKLYACGILGGITATFIGIWSWEIMFLFGGLSGLILYCLRKSLVESTEFLSLTKLQKRGNVFEVFANKNLVLKFLRLLMIITPFYFMISAMFIFLSFMHISLSLNHATKILLIFFFIGNLSSIVCYNYILKKYKHLTNKKILIFNTAIFAIMACIFMYVNNKTFYYYYFIIGFLCGALPTVWIDLVIKNYSTHIRNTATNLLYIGGRGTGIIFNFVFVQLLSNNFLKFNMVINFISMTIAIITFICIFVQN